MIQKKFVDSLVHLSKLGRLLLEPFLDLGVGHRCILLEFDECFTLWRVTQLSDDVFTWLKDRTFLGEVLIIKTI